MKLTPILLGERQMTRHGRLMELLGIIRSKFSGIPAGLATIRQAPDSDKLCATQSMSVQRRLNAILPAFRTRCRGWRRCSMVVACNIGLNYGSRIMVLLVHAPRF